MALAIQDIEPETVAPPVEAPPPVVQRTIPQVSRATVVDVDECGLWLIGRLKTKYPHHPDRTLIAWLRASTTDNECLFLRCVGGFALATLHRRFLTKPWVEVAFSMAKEEKDYNPACCLYMNIKEWAVGFGCSHVILPDPELNDCNNRDIYIEMGATGAKVAATWVKLIRE